MTSMKNLHMLTAVSLMLGGYSGPNPMGPVVPKDPPDPDNKPELDPVLLSPADRWKPLYEVDFSNPAFNTFIIDTRDFGTNAMEVGSVIKLDLKKVTKKPAFYVHSLDELMKLLSRYFIESGGIKEWRHFALKGVYRTEHWEMKYIHIHKMGEDQYLVCNQEKFIFNKHDLSQPVHLPNIRR